MTTQLWHPWLHFVSILYRRNASPCHHFWASLMISIIHVMRGRKRSGYPSTEMATLAAEHVTQMRREQTSWGGAPAGSV